MKWILIENTGDQFETVLKANNKTDAIKEAQAIYEKLSNHDKKRRKEFYIIYAEIEDGIIDFETEKDFVNILK